MELVADRRQVTPMKMLSDQKIGVHEPLEKLIQAEEEASGKGSVKFRMNLNVKSKPPRGCTTKRL